jgi:5-methylcytosine-specific restriction endonuclease McrA
MNCTVVACESSSYSRGLCRKHYAKERRNPGRYELLPKKTSPFCSRPCISCGRPTKPRVGGRGLCGTCYSDSRRSEKRYEIVCAGCGKPASVARNQQRYCSYACAMAAQRGRPSPLRGRPGQRRKSRELVLYTGPKSERKPRPNINPIPAPPGRRFKSVKCRQCGIMFVTLYTEVTCSEECRRSHVRTNRQLHKDSYRAKKRGAYVKPVNRKRVFELDGYKCHLCGKKTDPTKKAPHPRSPTVDHVFPLNRDGTHEPLNCRTACFQCNSKKGDRGGGEQLVLIA